MDEKAIQPAISERPVHYLAGSDCSLHSDTRQVIEEQPLTIEIQAGASYTIMCTPTDTIALTVGFLFAEGIIARRDDILTLMKCRDDPNTIRVQLAESLNAQAPKSNLLIVSSCGLCGREEMQKLINSLPRAENTLRLTPAELADLPVKLRAGQELFHRTGGTHAVALFREGQLLALAEDLGRHSAFDKAVGLCLLNGISPAGSAAAVSGRISFEIVAKAARAGVELIAAVSAPSALAIDTARQCNITLCGFVRGQEATVYCHPQRIIT